MNLDERTARLMNFAGFAMAHGIGGVSSGETLCTLAIVEREGLDKEGKMRLERKLGQFPGKIDASVAQARSALADDEGLVRAAIIYDGVVTVGDAESAAVVVETAWKDHLDSPTVALLRYKSISEGGSFRVLGEPLFASAESDEVEVLLREALMEGARSHDEAFGVWMRASEG